MPSQVRIRPSITWAEFLEYPGSTRQKILSTQAHYNKHQSVLFRVLCCYYLHHFCWVFDGDRIIKSNAFVPHILIIHKTCPNIYVTITPSHVFLYKSTKRHLVLRWDHFSKGTFDIFISDFKSKIDYSHDQNDAREYQDNHNQVSNHSKIRMTQSDVFFKWTHGILGFLWQAFDGQTCHINRQQKLRISIIEPHCAPQRYLPKLKYFKSY